MRSDTIADAIAANQQRIDQVQQQLNDLKQEVAAFEALLCQCQPQREHDDAGAQQTAADL